MNTVADLLYELNSIKINLRNAIITKGISITNDTPFYDYANKIMEIDGTPSENEPVIIERWI